MLNIKPTDRVLEVGSGNRPRKRSNVLCDKFLSDNYQRAFEENVVIDKRPFVVADGLALPFKDKTFDYVIASHILEHVEDPHKLISELMRVARRGYIESPSELGEKLFGWPFHQWIVRLEGETIVLRRRHEDSQFGDYFHQMYPKDPVFAEFVDSHFEDFYVQHEWAGDIKLRIEADSEKKVRPNSPAKRVEIRSRLKAAEISLVRAVLWPFLKLLRHFRKFDT